MVLYRMHTFQQLIMRYKSSHLNLEMILYGDVETLFTKYVFDIANFVFQLQLRKFKSSEKRHGKATFRRSKVEQGNDRTLNKRFQLQ